MNINRNCTFSKSAMLFFLFFSMMFSISSNANIISYQKTKDGVNFTLDKGKMFIHVVSDAVIEVKYTNLDALPEKKSLVVLDSVVFKKSFSVSETKDDILIKTSKLIVNVNRSTNAVTYTDLSGNEILAEANQYNKLMRDTTVAGIQTYSCATSFQ